MEYIFIAAGVMGLFTAVVVYQKAIKLENRIEILEIELKHLNSKLLSTEKSQNITDASIE